MTQDLASMKITQEIEDQVMALFAQIEALLPGLINTPDNDRSNSMGAKSERYVRMTMDLANQNAGLIPPDADLPGANQDLEARDRMMRITQRAQQFVKKCEDTTYALGSDLMVFSQIAYAVLKLLGKATGLDEAVKELGHRWSRRKKKPALAQEE